MILRLLSVALKWKSSIGTLTVREQLSAASRSDYSTSLLTFFIILGAFATVVPGAVAAQDSGGNGDDGWLPDGGITEAFLSAISVIFDVAATVFGGTVILFLTLVGKFLSTPIPPEAPGIAAEPGTGTFSSVFGWAGELHSFFAELAMMFIIMAAAYYILAIGVNMYTATSRGRILLMFALGIGGVAASGEIIGLFYEFIHAFTHAILPNPTEVGQNIFKESVLALGNVTESDTFMGALGEVGIATAGIVFTVIAGPMFIAAFQLTLSFILLVLAIFLVVRLIAVYSLYAMAPLILTVYVFKQGPANMLTGTADRFISLTTSMTVSVIPIAISIRVGSELAVAAAGEVFMGGFVVALGTFSGASYIGIKTTSTTKAIAGKVKGAAAIVGMAAGVAATGGSAAAVLKGAGIRGTSGAAAYGASEVGDVAQDKLENEGVPSPFDRIFGSDGPGSSDEEDQAVGDDEGAADPFEGDEDEDEVDAEDATESGATEDDKDGDPRETEEDRDQNPRWDVDPDDGEPHANSFDSQSKWSQTGDSGTDFSTDADSVDSAIDPDGEMGDGDGESPFTEDEMANEDGVRMDLSEGREQMSDEEIADEFPKTDGVSVTSDGEGNLVMDAPEGQIDEVSKAIDSATDGEADLKRTEDGKLKMPADDYENAIHGNILTDGKSMAFDNDAKELLGGGSDTDTPTPSGTMLDSETMADRYDLDSARRKAEANGNEELSKRLADADDQYLLESDDMPAELAEEVTPDSAVKSDELGGYVLDESEMEATAAEMNKKGAKVAPTKTAKQTLDAAGIESSLATQKMSVPVGQLGDVAPKGDNERVDITFDDDGTVAQINPSSSLDPDKAQITEHAETRLNENMEMETVSDGYAIDLSGVDSQKQAKLQRSLKELGGVEPMSVGKDTGEAYEWRLEEGAETEVAHIEDLMQTNGIGFQADATSAQNLGLESMQQATTTVDVPADEGAVMQLLPTDSGAIHATSASSPRDGAIMTQLNPETGTVVLDGSRGIDSATFADIVGPTVDPGVEQELREGDRFNSVELENRQMAQRAIQRAASGVGVQMETEDAQALGLGSTKTPTTSQQYQVDLSEMMVDTSAAEAVSIGGAGANATVNMTDSDVGGDYDVGVIEAEQGIEIVAPEGRADQMAKAIGTDMMDHPPVERGDGVVGTTIENPNKEHLEEIISRSQASGLDIRATRESFKRVGKDPSDLQAQVNVGEGDAVRVDYTTSGSPTFSKAAGDTEAQTKIKPHGAIEPSGREEIEIDFQQEAEAKVRELKESLEKREKDVRVIEEDSTKVRTPAKADTVLKSMSEVELDTLVDDIVFKRMAGVRKISQQESSHDEEQAGYHADGWMLGDE